MFKLKQLNNLTRNPRKISDADLECLKISISGFEKMLSYRPIVYDPITMEILGGNQRFVILNQLEYKEVPDEWVRSASDLTEEEKRRFVIADNASFGDFDFDILKADWDMDELAKWGLEIEFPEIDVLDDIDFDNIKSNEDRNMDKPSKEVTCPDCGHKFLA